MSNENAKIDNNFKKTLLGVTDDASAELRRLLVDPTTGRLKVSAIITTGAGITTLNGLSGAIQTFAVGTGGTDFAISSATTIHTFNLPTASATNRGALSSADWTTFNGKQDGHANLTSLAGLSYVSTSFVKMTNAGTFALDTNVYLTAVTAHNLLSATHGDTTAANVVRGDIIIGDSSTKWIRLAKGTTKAFITCDANDVAWSTGFLDITTNKTLTVTENATISGTPLSNPMTTLGDIIYEDATPAPARLAGNTTTTKKYLAQTGTGIISAIPAWSQIAITELAAFTSANFAGVCSDEVGTDKLVFNTAPGFTTSCNPLTNDAATLGTTALGWSDLYLASGGKIDWENGDVVLTHSTNVITMTGDAITKLAFTNGYQDITYNPTTAGGGTFGLRTTVTQTTNALTGTLKGATITATNGAFASSGTIYGLEVKARAALPDLTGGNVGVLTGAYLASDVKDKTVTTCRGVEIVLGGVSGASVTEAVGLRISNNFQATIATTQYGIEIYCDSTVNTADIKMSSGGLIGGSGGHLKITSGGVATFSSDIELGHASDTTLHRVSAGLVSIEGANIMTVSSADTVTGVKTLGTTGAIKLGSAVGDKCEIRLNDAALNDESWSGTVLDAVAGATLAVGDVCYLKTSDGQWYLNDGILDGTDTGFALKLGICVLAANDNDATKILLDGLIASAAFPAFTVGAPVYLDDTAGDLVVAQPTTTNFAIRVVGEAISATVLHFHPSNDYIVHI
jgi:hypothetical protein